MDNQLSRTKMLIGEENIKRIKNSRVAVFGIGGVGGYTAEILARSGVGSIDLIDSDKVDITNLNRQIIATHKTVGMLKVDAAKERIEDINPETVVTTHNIFFDSTTAESFDFANFDYIVDAIDTVSSKILLVLKAKEKGIPIISCMGTGNKLNAAQLEVTDIFKTSVCPLAKVMRYELKKRGINKLKVVYSKEEPIKPIIQQEQSGRHIPASSAFVPAAAGVIIAGEVIKDIIDNLRL